MSNCLFTGDPDMEHDKLKRSWADKVYYSSHKSGRKRGVSM